jgi:hypothetical protein
MESLLFCAHIFQKGYVCLSKKRLEGVAALLTWDGWDSFQQCFGDSYAFYRIVFVIFLQLNGFER